MAVGGETLNGGGDPKRNLITPLGGEGLKEGQTGVGIHGEARPRVRSRARGLAYLHTHPEFVRTTHVGARQ